MEGEGGGEGGGGSWFLRTELRGAWWLRVQWLRAVGLTVNSLILFQLLVL